MSFCKSAFSSSFFSMAFGCILHVLALLHFPAFWCAPTNPNAISAAAIDGNVVKKLLLEANQFGSVINNLNATKVEQAQKDAAVAEQLKSEFLAKFAIYPTKVDKVRAYSVAQLDLDVPLLKGFLGVEDNVHLLWNVIAYITKLSDVPICMSKITLQSIDALNRNTELLADLVGARARCTKNVLRKQYGGIHEAGQAAGEQQRQQPQSIDSSELAFLFGQKGIAEILIAENGYKCGQSLLSPKLPAQLFQLVVQVLAEQQQQQQQQQMDKNPDVPFDQIINAVVSRLKESGTLLLQQLQQQQQQTITRELPSAALLTATSSPPTAIAAHHNDNNVFAIFVERVHNKWEDLKLDMQQKANWTAVEHYFEDGAFKMKVKKFAVWLFLPRHVEDVIQIILFFTGAYTAYDISVQVLHILGIDQLFEDAVKRMGADMIALGANKKVVRWFFGPNGIVPLFISENVPDGADADTEFDELVDRQGKKYQLKKVHMQQEARFFMNIVQEVIHHRGQPAHELMDHMVQSFDRMEESIKGKWAGAVMKWKAEWNDIKHMHLSDMKAELKKFGAWLVTPDRVNTVIRLVLSLTGTSTPVYLTLEVLEMFHITDLFLKELNVVDTRLQSTAYYQQHPNQMRAVEFMIGANGVVPLFLGQGEWADTDAHQQRLSDEADIIKIVTKVVVKHQSAGALFPAMFQYLIGKFETEDFYLRLIQRWNLLQNDLNARRSASEASSNTSSPAPPSAPQQEEASTEEAASSPANSPPSRNWRSNPMISMFTSCFTFDSPKKCRQSQKAANAA